jgi:hypothetical protein
MTEDKRAAIVQNLKSAREKRWPNRTSRAQSESGSHLLPGDSPQP